MPEAQRIHGLYPVGGYANAIGVFLTALNEGLSEIKARAASYPPGAWHAKVRPDLPTPTEVLLHIGEVEVRWIHAGIGGRTSSPPPPAPTATLAEIFAWLDSVRATTAAVLKPLVEADLERTRPVADSEGKARGKTMIRKILMDSVEHQAYMWGRASVLVSLASR